ncbi:MAG: hypothetical protein NW241_02740 [Bacteroidia bacterium]|nr:hypothetical protein [Bacteroidia bacterium]
MCKPLCSVWMLLAMGAMLQAQPGIPQQFPFSGTLLHDGAPYDTEKPGNTRADLQVYFFNGAPDAGSVAGDVFRQVFVNQPTNTIGAFALTVNDPAVPAVGDWTAIDWLGGDVWMVVTAEISNQPAEEVARFRVLPMPYAMYAVRTEQVNPAHAVNGQVLKYNGTEFVPGTDSVRVYQAGAGISISGNTIAAQDTSSANELQSLSLQATMLSLVPQTSGTMPVNISPKIAVLKEVKPAAANGGAGTFTAAQWTNRLMTEVKPDYSTSSNENNFVYIPSGADYFTLQPGKYYIRAIAPAYSVGRHIIVLRTLAGVDDIIGRSSYALEQAGSRVQTDAELIGFVDINVATSYRILHRCSVTNTTYGLGLVVESGWGILAAPMTVVEIIKLR